MQPVLTTERLIARPWTTAEGDLEAAYDIYSRADVATWLGASPEPDQIRVRVARWAQPTSDPTYGVWAVEERKRPGVPVGSVALRPLAPADEDVEVAWHLHPAVWGKGYATEIGRAAAERAFRTGIEEVFAVVRPGNARSVAVARRLGAEYVGITEKYYSLRLELHRLRPAELVSPGRMREYAGLG